MGRPIKPRITPFPAQVEGARWIPLTRGKFTLVDDSDYSFLSQYNWTFTDCGRGYALRTLTQDGKRLHQLIHRLIMAAPSDLEVDHKDGDSLNNRRNNLRICTHKNNRSNTRKHKDNTSGFKGVCWHKAAEKWSAHVKGIYLGLFDDKETAARSYDEAAKQIFGPYASLNFPENP